MATLKLRTVQSQAIDQAWTALGRTFDWAVAQRDGEGRVLCPEHLVEHSGKNAGLIVIALELAKRAGAGRRKEFVAIALQQGDRLVANLEREGTSPCFTFRPGRHDPFNCSNSVIDGGAAADALGSLVRELTGELPEEKLAPYREACLKHARTYLRYAILDKGVPAQRAWGMTGLGAAFRLEPDPILGTAAAQGIELLRGVQHADGSYPYHPMAWGAGHTGASDVSAYYQSRVTAFLLHAAGDLNLEPHSEALEQPLRSGLDFLLGMQAPDGLKCGLLEAKPWYWGANYEVASHPFDVAALAYGWRAFGERRYADGAVRALKAWTEHVDGEGVVHSHLPGPGRSRSYQCPMFWTGHAMWLARALSVLQNLDEDLSGNPRPRGPLLVEFKDAGLYRLEDETVVAWVRGARPAGNVAHGSPHGAGLIRVLRKADGVDLLPRCRWGGHQAGEWCGKAGGMDAARGLRAGAKELRFSLWTSRVHWRARRRLLALKNPLTVFKRGVLAFAHPRVSSAFDLSPQVEPKGPGALELSSGLAWRDGTPVAGTRLRREFQVDGRGLLVRDILLAGPGVRGLDYRVPEYASEVERDGDEIRYRLA